MFDTAKAFIVLYFLLLVVVGVAVLSADLVGPNYSVRDLSSLVLPRLISLSSTLLPVAVVFAVAFSKSDAHRSGEGFAMQSAGASPLLLALPGVTFGLIATALALLLNCELLPRIVRQLGPPTNAVGVEEHILQSFQRYQCIGSPQLGSFVACKWNDRRRLTDVDFVLRNSEVVGEAATGGIDFDDINQMQLIYLKEVTAFTVTGDPWHVSSDSAEREPLTARFTEPSIYAHHPFVLTNRQLSTLCAALPTTDEDKGHSDSDLSRAEILARIQRRFARVLRFESNSRIAWSLSCLALAIAPAFWPVERANFLIAPFVLLPFLITWSLTTAWHSGATPSELPIWVGNTVAFGIGILGYLRAR